MFKKLSSINAHTKDKRTAWIIFYIWSSLKIYQDQISSMCVFTAAYHFQRQETFSAITDDRESSRCQLCCHLLRSKNSLRQPTVVQWRQIGIMLISGVQWIFDRIKRSSTWEHILRVFLIVTTIFYYPKAIVWPRLASQTIIQYTRDIKCCLPSLLSINFVRGIINWHGIQLVTPVYCGGGIKNDELDKHVSALFSATTILTVPDNLRFLCVFKWEQIQMHILMIPKSNPARQGLIWSLKLKWRWRTTFISLLNPFYTSAVCTCTWSTLLQIMACALPKGIKPLPESILTEACDMFNRYFIIYEIFTWTHYLAHCTFQ